MSFWAAAGEEKHGSFWAEVLYEGRLDRSYLLVYLCRDEREDFSLLSPGPLG